MKRSAIGLGLLGILVSTLSYGQERRSNARPDDDHRVYEGVVGLKQRTIGTLILLDQTGGTLQGWMRLSKFVPIEGGSVLPSGVEFRAGGNRYEIDERRARINYSGPDGEGSRFIQRLERFTGKFFEHTESRSFDGWNIAKIEVAGRLRDFRVGRPALWKHSEAPFETFERVTELLGKELVVWVAEADTRTGRVVGVEEPAGMNIPLKAPKKPKEEKKEEEKKK
ncbi:MAG: hypothetical protein HW398_991 [Acidobacteria bacterium]|nr:hypothetical protein [Acidobacteriota bacterium]